MKLKQVAILVMGLLPLGVIAQTNKLQIQPPPGAAHPGAVPTFAQGQRPMAQPAPEMPEKGKLSYAIGMFFGKNITNSLKRGELVVDTNSVIEALTAVIEQKPTHMTETEMTSVMNQLKAAMQPRMKAEHDAEMKKKEEEANENKAKGEAFLAQFAKAAGVTTLSNGLEYKIIKAGNGPKPKESDTVTVNYRGTLVDGTEFDQHDGFTTPVKGRVIQGWQKILPLMNVGSKWQVAIPANLGYGPRGMAPKIAGNSVLIFDLELTSVTAGPPTLAPKPVASAGPNATASSSGTPVVSGEIIKVPSKAELDKGAKIEVIKSGQTNTGAPQ